MILPLSSLKELRSNVCCVAGMEFMLTAGRKKQWPMGDRWTTTPNFKAANRCPLCNAHTASFKKTGKMIKSLKKWVKKKKSWAVTDLALMTFHGDGVPKNKPKGINMLKKAIAFGDSNAMVYLGGIFLEKLMPV